MNVARLLARIGPEWLPFADAVSEELPLRRLLRLGLFQVTVGMTLALLAGTLNRVMIVELAMSAWIVGAFLAVPMLQAPTDPSGGPSSGAQARRVAIDFLLIDVRKIDSAEVVATTTYSPEIDVELELVLPDRPTTAVSLVRNSTLALRQARDRHVSEG